MMMNNSISDWNVAENPSTSQTMVENYGSSSAAYLYVIERWSTSIGARDFVLALVAINFVLCSTALSFLKGPAKERYPWRRPSTYPMSVPVIGHLLRMAWDSSKFLSAVVSQCRNAPTVLKLLVTDMYVVSGPENIKTLFRQPDLNTKVYRALSFKTMCKMPKDALAFWMSDDSGMHAQPHPESQVPAHLRVDYMTHDAVAKLLTGVGLKPLCDRFTRNLSQRLLAIPSVGAEWVEHPDLFAFMQNELLTPAVEAMWGTKIFSLEPDFGHDIWQYSRGLPYLAKGYPRWLAPSAYKARDKCLDSVKHWHRSISASLDSPAQSMDRWNPEYGTEFVKYRHRAWSQMPRMNADAIASEDLGMIWAVNANSVPASFWMLAEIIRDRQLLTRIRRTIAKHRIESPPGTLVLDWTSLCNEPLLQSVYAETLRLHVAIFVLRSSDRKDVHIGGWHIPRRAAILISGYDAQMAAEDWTRTDDPHVKPVSEFWAERFLQDPSPKGDPTFSLKGRAGSWLPYGGGQRMCPGRHFNKLEMISSLAIMLTLFDVEISDGADRIPANDMTGFGFGTLWPKAKMPVRIRRRGV